MTQTRREFRAEAPSRGSWDAVRVELARMQLNCPPNKVTRRYLEAFKKRKPRQMERYSLMLEAHSLLVQLDQDPRTIGYPVSQFMKVLVSIATRCGWPSEPELIMLTKAGHDALVGTAYGVTWAESLSDWKHMPASPAEPVYRRIRRSCDEHPGSSGSGAGAGTA